MDWSFWIYWILTQRFSNKGLEYILGKTTFQVIAPVQKSFTLYHPFGMCDRMLRMKFLEVSQTDISKRKLRTRFAIKILQTYNSDVFINNHLMSIIIHIPYGLFNKSTLMGGADQPRWLYGYQMIFSIFYLKNCSPEELLRNHQFWQKCYLEIGLFIQKRPIKLKPRHPGCLGF